MKNFAPLTVRLTLEDRKTLDQKASRLGTTPTELSRRLLSNALDEENELAQIRMRMTALESSVSALREDLAVAVQALLITKGAAPITTSEQAEAWVTANLKCG
jgi:hypothetical protein